MSANARDQRRAARRGWLGRERLGGGWAILALTVAAVVLVVFGVRFLLG